MSILSVAKDHPASPVLGVHPGGPREPAHPLIRIALGLLHLAAVLGAALETATRRGLVLAARLGRWFAAEPRRIRVALVGLGVCLVVGAAIGVTAGIVVTRLVDAALAFISDTGSA